MLVFLTPVPDISLACVTFLPWLKLVSISGTAKGTSSAEVKSCSQRCRSLPFFWKDTTFPAYEATRVHPLSTFPPGRVMSNTMANIGSGKPTISFEAIVPNMCFTPCFTGRDKTPDVMLLLVLYQVKSVAGLTIFATIWLLLLLNYFIII